MVSLKPKEGDSFEPPSRPPSNNSGQTPIWIPIALIVAVIAISVVAYSQYSAKTALEQRIAQLESKDNQFDQSIQSLKKADGSLASDRKSTRLNSSHVSESRMPSSA